MIVGASDVTLAGNVTFVTGEKSWYAVNVDSRLVSDQKTGATLKLDDNCKTVFEGTNKIGIYIENTAKMGVNKVKVTFGENTSVSSNIGGFKPIVFAVDKNGDPVKGSVVDPDNAGLKDNGDGTYSLIQVSSSGSHHNYQWMHNNDKHWQLCSDCGSVINEGTHNFQWKQDENGVGYQQCAECGYRKSATQTAAATNNATASASASASTTTNATATAEIPQTSDASNPLLWVVLRVISGSAFGGLMVYKKKKEDC